MSIKQDITTFARPLPRPLKEVPLLYLGQHWRDLSTHNYHVKRQRVWNVFHWLKKNNKLYRHVEIATAELNKLSEHDTVPKDINTMDDPYLVPKTKDKSNDDTNMLEDTKEGYIVSRATANGSEIEKIKSELLGSKKVPVPWPNHDTDGIYEFDNKRNPEQTYPILADSCFPKLFPFGTEDWTGARNRKFISLQEACHHYTKYPDVQNDGSLCYRFAFHRQFPFWIMDMIRRHTL